MQHYLKIAAAAALLVSLPSCMSSTSSSGETTAALTGTPATCIRTVEIKKQTILSDSDIQFEMNDGDVYTNHLPHKCTGLKSQGGFAWNVHNGTACSNQEIIHVLDNGPTCTIGEFRKQPSAT